MFRMTSTSAGRRSPDSSRPMQCMMISVSVSRARWLSSSASSSSRSSLVVGQLAVEGEAEPLVLLHVLPLERLGVAAVFGAAGGVADMADRRPAGMVLHQAFVLAPVAHAKDFADAAHLLVGVDQLVAQSGLNVVMPAESWPRFWMSSSIRGMSRETSSGPCSGQSGLDLAARQVIDGRDAAFVKKLTHRHP